MQIEWKEKGEAAVGREAPQPGDAPRSRGLHLLATNNRGAEEGGTGPLRVGVPFLPPARGPSSPWGCRGGSPRFLMPRGTALLRLILELLHRLCASQASCWRRGKPFCFTGPRGTFTHPAVVPSGRPAATRLEKDILSQSEVPLPPRLGFEIISVSLLS